MASETFPGLYRHVPRLGGGTRLFLALRWRFTPYAKMAEKLPRQGRILDLGCGHGLLAYALALDSPEREILGIDHDPERVRLAQSAFLEKLGTRVRIVAGSALSFSESIPADLNPDGPFAGIAAIDVMHYFRPEEQERILKAAWQRLAPGGTLIVREVDPEGGAASRINRAYEKLATLTGFTRSEEQAKLHFRSPQGWLELLARTGFEATSMPCSHFLFADVLYVARKP